MDGMYRGKERDSGVASIMEMGQWKGWGIRYVS